MVLRIAQLALVGQAHSVGKQIGQLNQATVMGVGVVYGVDYMSDFTAIFEIGAINPEVA